MAKRTSKPKEEAIKNRLSLEQLIAEANKKFGAGTLVLGSNAQGLIKPRISTGSFALDIVTGGGYPEGGIELLEGDSGVSKSWSLHRRAANFLAKYEDGYYILVNAEGSNDPPFLQMLGVDLERTCFISPNSGEEAWDAAHFIAQHASKVYLGVDSLDAMVPLAELEGNMDEAQMAPAARMNNKGFRKLITIMRSDIEKAEHRITAGFICQLREKVGVFFGDPATTVGGKGKVFAATMRTGLRKVSVLRTEGKLLVEKFVYGLEIEAHVLKNKGVGEGEKVRYKLYKENYEGFRRGQIDNVTELIPFLILYGVVKKAGAWYEYDGQKYQGDATFAQVLRDHDDFRDYLIQQVKDEVAKRHRIDPAELAEPKKRLPKAGRRRK